LYKNRFIIDSNLNAKDEINYLFKRNSISFKKPIFKVFYIIVTTECNFRCKYCYLSLLKNYNPRVMNLETAKGILSYFYEYIKKVEEETPKLVLYGGEPLLNKKIMKFIIEDVRKNIKDKKIPHTNIILITNGSLIDDNIADFLKENKVLIALSLDGQQRINDLNRVYKNGKGTFEDIIKAINLLNKRDIRPTISCTINKRNVNKMNTIIPWMVKNFNIDSLGLNLFSGGDCSNKLIKKLSKDSAKQIVKAFELCRKYGVYEDTVIRQMEAFVNEKPNIYSCAATGREISVDPEGNLATCPAFLNTNLFPFNIKDKLKLESNREFRRWVKKTPLLTEECYDCIALGICGGGCAFNSYKNHKNIYAKDDFYCEYAKTTTKWMLKDLFKIIRNKNG